MKTIPKYRRPLNHHQKEIIECLYKFRFGTTKLIAKYLESKSTRTVTKSLKILLDQEYIGRNYNSSYRIKGRPASYYLRPKSFKYLKQQELIGPLAINRLYHDKRGSKTHIAHCLKLFDVYIEFIRLNQMEFEYYSKAELDGNPNLPEYLPDAYFQRFKQSQVRDNHFFLEYCAADMPYFLSRRLIKRYIGYAEEGRWETKVDAKLPTILLVCQTKAIQRRMIWMAYQALDRTYVEMTFLATTLEALEQAGSAKVAIWQKSGGYYKAVFNI